eukprot:jgi/Mesvir1/4039/Mv19400-RA.1
MVAQGNVGLAFGLVIGAGLSTTIGATFALCAKLSDKRLLASSLGVSAGVMMYVSFVEIFATKSVSGFEDTGMSTGKSYLFATLSFFGGVLMTVLLDKLVHLLGHSDDHDFPATSGPSLNQRSHAADVIKRSDSSKTALSLRTYKVADSESSRSSSLSLPVGLMGPYKEEGPATTDKSTQERSATERGVQEKLTKERGAETEEDHATLLGLAPAPQSSPSVPPRSRSEPPVDLAVVLVVPALDDGSLKDDTVLHDGTSLLIEGSTRQRVDGPVGTRARAGGTSGRRRGGSLSSDYDDLRDRKELHRMGLMTALAVSIHNFPEGLATFVAALADSRLGATIAVAIAVHNIPEGICVAMPVYYATGSRWKGFLWSVLIGVSEPLGALLGYAVLANHFSDLVFGVLFGGVAGMMVYISASELLPTARKYDPEDKYVSICFVLGMAVIATSLVLFAL